MRRLDPAYRACFADGSTINVRYGREAMRDEIAQKCGSVDAAAFESFVDWLRRLYVIEMPNFIDRNFDTPLDLLSSPRALVQLLRLGAFGRLGAAVRRRFTDPRLHRLFSFQAMYAGLAPESALALYAVITYMDSIEGVWFPEGGIHAVPMIMAQVAEKAGVTFRYGDAAEEVLRSPRDGLRVSARRPGTESSPTLWSALLICQLRTSNCSVIFARRERLRRGRLFALGGGLACRGTRTAAVLGRPPQHPLRHRMELRVRRAAQARRADARPVAAGHHPLPRRLGSRTRWLLHALRSGTRA